MDDKYEEYKGLSVGEIISNTELKNTLKTKLLYLSHNKTYEEIAELLNLKLATVKFNVSIGGYCKVKRGQKQPKFGDLRTIIKQRFEENPDLDYAEICKEFGCSSSIVRRYLHELGIKFKRSTMIADVTNQHTGDTISEQNPDASTTPPEMAQMACRKFDAPERVIYPHTPKKSQESSETTEAVNVVEKEPPDVAISETVANPEESDTDAEPSAAPTEPEKKARKPRTRTVTTKPYSELEYPYVLYKGQVYEILSASKLRKELRKDLNIK